MRRLVPQLRYAWWKLVLFRFVLYSIAASGQLAPSCSNLNFGAVQVANGRTLSVTASNSGKSNLTISQANVSGTGFSFAGPGLPITLGPQQAATLSVTFAPQAGGSISGSMSLASLNPVGNSGKQHLQQHQDLSGTGISFTAAAAPGYLAPNPASVSFESIQVAQSDAVCGSDELWRFERHPFPGDDKRAPVSL
jgi:hypothetical protein